MTDAMSCAASACIPGTTCACCVNVNAGDSWPSLSLITLTGTPALTAIGCAGDREVGFFAGPLARPPW